MLQGHTASGGRIVCNITLLTMIHLIWSIIIGFIVGLIARAVYPGGQQLGFFVTALIGIAGSFVGGLIGMAISRPAPGTKFHPAGFLMSIVGALIVLYLYIHFSA